MATTRKQRRQNQRVRDALEHATTQTDRMETDAFEGSFAGECKVDREANVVRGCKVLGFTSKNGRRFTTEAIKASVTMYEGKQVYLDHPSMADIAKARNIRDRNGILKNSRFVEGSGVHADWHFNPKHQATEAMLHEIENNPSTLGLSHNARYRYGKAEAGQDVVESIVAVRSVDFVTEPATTNGMFEGVIAEKMADDELTEKIDTAAGMLRECCYDRTDAAGHPIDRKAKALAVATDLIAELNKPTPAATESQSGDTEMELKDFTLEAIIAGRTDVAELSAKAKSSDADRNELESLRAEKAARTLADAIEAEIVASGCDRSKLTPAITKTLNALESVDRVALLTDIAAMAKPTGTQTQKPVTSAKIADATESIDALAFAAQITGIKPKK